MDTHRTIKPNLWTALLLLAGCFCVYSLTMTENHLGYEGETIAQAAALVRGEPTIEGRAGLLDIILYAPWVAAAEVASQLNLIPIFQGLLPNFALPLCMALTVVCVFGMACEMFTFGTAISLALIFAFGTMAWPYSKMGMETGLTLASAIAGWGMARLCEKGDTRGWGILAAGLGLMLLTKVTAPLVIVLHLVAALTLCLRKQIAWPSRRAWTICVGIALFGAAAFVVGNYWRFGRWIFSTRYSMNWESEPPDNYFANLLGFLVSPGKSFFLYNPPVWLAAAGLVRWLKRKGSKEILLIIILPQLLFHAYFRTWADETWGPRRLLNLLPLIMLPLGSFLESRSDLRGFERRIFPLVIAGGLIASLWMQSVAVSMNYASYIRALQPGGFGTQRNLIWNPATTHYRFQSILFRSWLSRVRGGPSYAFVIDPASHSDDPKDFLPWNSPEEFSRTPTDEIALGEYDLYPDMWWAQRIHHFQGRSFWKDKALYLMLAFVLGAFGSFAALYGIARRQSKYDSSTTDTKEHEAEIQV